MTKPLKNSIISSVYKPGPEQKSVFYCSIIFNCFFAYSIFRSYLYSSRPTIRKELSLKVNKTTIIPQLDKGHFQRKEDMLKNDFLINVYNPKKVCCSLVHGLHFINYKTANSSVCQCLLFSRTPCMFDYVESIQYLR